MQRVHNETKVWVCAIFVVRNVHYRHIHTNRLCDFALGNIRSKWLQYMMKYVFSYKWFKLWTNCSFNSNMNDDDNNNHTLYNTAHAKIDRERTGVGARVRATINGIEMKSGTHYSCRKNRKREKQRRDKENLEIGERISVLQHIKLTRNLQSTVSFNVPTKILNERRKTRLKSQLIAMEYSRISRKYWKKSVFGRNQLCDCICTCFSCFVSILPSIRRSFVHSIGLWRIANFN